MAITPEPVKVREESNKEVHDWTHGSRRRPAHLLIGRQSFDFLSDQLYVHSQRNALFTTPTRAERKKLSGETVGVFLFLPDVIFSAIGLSTFLRWSDDGEPNGRKSSLR